MSLKLNLGCGYDLKEGWLNVDYASPVTVDLIDYLFERRDLNETPWPWKDGSVSRIYMEDVLEHLADPMEIVKEVHRVLQDDGIADILVPHKDSPGAYKPGHYHYFHEKWIEPFTERNSSASDIHPIFKLEKCKLWHRFPFCYHQRKYLGTEIIGFGKHKIHWRLKK